VTVPVQRLGPSSPASTTWKGTSHDTLVAKGGRQQADSIWRDGPGELPDEPEGPLISPQIQFLLSGAYLDLGCPLGTQRAEGLADINEGRDVSAVQPTWNEYRDSVEAGDNDRKEQAFRQSRKVFRHGLGRRLGRRWLMASLGANWALTAIVTWDLVTEIGPYRQVERDALLRPWRSVALLPPSCD
jgi:hypothetical protein